jgi:hypothetical protein
MLKVCNFISVFPSYNCLFTYCLFKFLIISSLRIQLVLEVSDVTDFLKFYFKRSGVVWQLFNMWGKIIIDLYAWAVDILFVSSQVWCWLIKILVLSGIFIVDFRVYCELVSVFILNIVMENIYWDMRGNIFNLLNTFLQEPSLLQPSKIWSDNSLLHSKYYIAVCWNAPEG